MVEIGLFMNGATLPQDFKERIERSGFGKRALCNGTVEAREMAAVQVADQFGRT